MASVTSGCVLQSTHIRNWDTGQAFSPKLRVEPAVAPPPGWDVLESLADCVVAILLTFR